MKRIVSLAAVGSNDARKNDAMSLRKGVLAVAFAVVAVCVVLAGAVVADAQSTQAAWAPADTANIRPGNMTFTGGAQCTSNFIFYDGSNNVYIGQAAHCSSTEGNAAPNDCVPGSLPLGTEVQVEGASRPGTLVYNSWLTMQAKGETDPNACLYNDFALVKLEPTDAAATNPTIPFWGGPTGITGTTSFGDKALSYGNSSLRGGVSALSPKEGTSLGQSGGGWTHQVYTATPGIPGDSGSAFIDGQGRAFGVLSTVQFAPLAGSNGVGDLSRELAYMHANSSLRVSLAYGTEPFVGPLLP